MYAQTPTTVQGPIAPIAVPAPFDPAADYITAGQDEPGYRSWYLAAPWRAAQVKAFNDYLAGAQVSGIVPTWQLLRTATSWKDCGGQPFEVPPRKNGSTWCRPCVTCAITSCRPWVRSSRSPSTVIRA